MLTKLANIIIFFKITIPILSFVFSLIEQECLDGTLAYAFSCVQDDYGRPSVGAIYMCPDVSIWTYSLIVAVCILIVLSKNTLHSSSFGYTCDFQVYIQHMYMYSYDVGVCLVFHCITGSSRVL